MRIDSKARDRANGFTPVLATSLSALVLATGAMYAEPAQAVSVCVRVASYRAPMPDGTTARMWGYQVAPNPGNTIDCNQATSGSAINQAVTSPGDAITVPANDTTLTVTLINRVSANPGVVNTNGETALAVPTSFVLQGHNTTMVPVFKNAAGNDCTPGGTATDMAALQAIRECRVRSFTHEAAPGQHGRLHLQQCEAGNLYVPERHDAADPGPDGPLWNGAQECRGWNPGERLRQSAVRQPDFTAAVGGRPCHPHRSGCGHVQPKHDRLRPEVLQAASLRPAGRRLLDRDTGDLHHAAD